MKKILTVLILAILAALVLYSPKTLQKAKEQAETEEDRIAKYECLEELSPEECTF